ncbi:MAG: efflux RND transporter permease subunit [Eubacterium sp.]|nr:efflux RND transporter permease subunit [Eubacterium sp.]
MISRFSVKKPFTVLVAVIMIIIFGVVSFTRLTPDLFPKIELPYVAIVTTYPGASAQEVEETVTSPLEQNLASLENLKNINSTSQKNASMIFLEFEQDAELDTVSVDIRDKAEMASAGWPETIQKPIIMKLNPSMIPVTVAGISQEGKTIVETSQLLNDGLLRKLEGTEGVASVSATGLVENTIHVSVDSKKIDAVNKKIQNSVSGVFNDAKSQINNQISNGSAAASQLKAAKNEIKNGQNMLIDQGDQLKEVLSSMKTMVVIKEGLVGVNKGLEDGVKKLHPEYTDDQIKAELAKNKIYTDNAANIAKTDEGINMIIGQLKAAEFMFKEMGVSLSSLTTLDGINKAETALNKYIRKNTNELANGMAEVTGNEALLNSANMQLQASLAQIEAQETSAKSSADVSQYLTVDGVSGLITAQNFEMPAGFISEDGNDVLVTVGNKVESPKDFEKMILLDMNMDGIEPITLADVANITYVASGADNYSKINGENGIMLVFSKQSDYSTTEVAGNVQKAFEEIEKEYKGVKFATLSDQGDYIKLAVSSVLESLVLGGILAIIILLIFLRDIKPTMITAISIPISITFAIALMYFSGITLNVISLSGLAVGVGMLVDNSIVVVENIYRLRSLGYSKKEAAMEGAHQVAGAITASTLTTVCVFAPIVFAQGLTKVIFKDMALTVTYSLLASLIVALTVVPALSGAFINKTKENTMLNKESRGLKIYRRLLEKVLHHKVITLAVVMVLLVGSVVTSVAKGFIFMPPMSSPQISATVEMYEDAEKDDTFRINDEIAAEVAKIPGVNTVGVTLSTGVGGMLGMGGGGEADFSSVTYYIIMDEDKMENSDKVNKTITKLAEKYKCESSVTEGMDMSMMLGGSGITVNIEGDDLDDLRDSAVMIEDELAKLKGVDEVSDIDEKSTEEIVLLVNEKKAAEKGLTVAQLYMQVAEKISTEKTATSLNYEGEKRDVIVSSKSEEPLNRDQLMNLTIKGSGSAASETFKLKDVVTVKNEKALQSISRLNQKRTETVTASIEKGYNVTLMTDKAEKALEGIKLPEGVSYEFSGENEQIMDAMGQMMLMAALGVVFIYLVMVAQFQSLILPFIVMFTVPLAITGGLLGLLVCGYEISVIAMIGAVMLMGIIVNNGIVLIDYINQARARGKEKRQAIIEASTVRIRPVLMTALTTVLGLLPMAFAAGEGAEMIQPVAVVCIGGLIYATLMTLFIIPVMYDILGRVKKKK